MGERRRLVTAALAVAAAGVILAGCGGDDEPAADGAPEVIRFAFAPDPVWDYLIDTGTMAEWEAEYNLVIETSESWDEFAYFAGGHGDIVSMGTHELPVLEAETGIKVVAFGAYNHQRVPMYSRAEDGYNTLADVPLGSRTCMSSSVSNTIVWSIIANELHGLNYRVGEGDFDIAVQDHFVMPELVDRGECVVAAAIPEAATPLLRSGDLKVMYDGRSPWRVYQEDICKCGHRGIMSNLFVATESWYDEHPEQAAAFLDLWERGVELWQRDKAEIIAKYPQHFSVESQEDIDYMIGFMEGPNDWFVQTVYMDEAWVTEEMKFYDYMVAGNWMAADAALPRFESIQP